MKFLFFCFLINSSIAMALDLSTLYQKKQVEDTQKKQEEIKNLIGNDTIVFIPGILAQTVIEDSNQPIKFSFLLGDYFRDYLTWCKEVNIKCQRIILESEASVQENSETLKSQLLKIDGPIWVVSHSKGSLEFLNTLLKNQEVIGKTKGWISLQAPFWGAVSGNIYLENKVLNKAAGWLLSFLGGGIKAIESISLKERQLFNRENKDEIDRVLKTVNHIHYGSFIDDADGVESILEFSRDQILKLAGPNDGLVELKSTRYENSNYIIESGYDHLVTILDLQKIKNLPYVIDEKNKNWKIDRPKFIQDLLLLFKR